MANKNTLLLVSFWVVFFFGAKNLYAQTPKKILLVDALDSISSTHNIFFTYNPIIIKKEKIDISPFKNLSLQESISLLKKITFYEIDYLGNNYYVLYKRSLHKLPASKRYIISKTSDSIANQNLKQGNTKFKRFIRGLVIDQYYQPIPKVNIIEEGTLNGTISRNDGAFEMELLENNTLLFSHIGYEPKTIKFDNEDFLRIQLASGFKLDEVFVVGSRNKNRKKIDAPVSTDVIQTKNVKKKSEFLEVNQFIQSEIPSFNATRQSGSDGSDHITPASYRGLGPDQTLVLINGKRRHQSSLINLYGTRGRGNSGTDLNSIPTAAIQQIEVLKDGASAQYGSDAIAGVINIVLNDNSEKTNINSTFGFYNASNNTNPERKGIDGLTYKIDINHGAKIYKNGFINLTAEFLTKENTFRQGTDIRENYGDAAVTGSNIFVNSKIPISKKIKGYIHGGFNYRNTQAYAFTRPSDSERNVQSIYPEGFNPLITSNISDKSLTVGLEGKLNQWNIDFSNTLGENYFHYFIKETLNATLLENSPTEFDAGGHSLRQNTTNFDISRYYPSFLKGINIAFGLENRIENYQIFAGEEASYGIYDNNGNLATNLTPVDQIPTFNGTIRPGGSQGFPGYSPSNEVNRNRNSLGIYLDTEIDFTAKWLLAAALRFENYSDFGNTINTKLAFKYSITQKTNIRFSLSTGFRAPSLAQIYYNLKFTNYIDNTPVESFLIANNNPITRRFGIDQLKEEKAVNYGLAIHHKFNENLYFSVDSYFINIKDRIILSGNFDASSLNANVENVQFFANGVNTVTYGLDFRFNWMKKFSKNKTLGTTFSGNLNHIDITNINNKELDKETFFGIREQYFLRASAPNYKLLLNAIYSNGKISLSNTLTKYSNLSLIDWQIQKPLSEFNNSEKERLEASIDNYDARFTLDSHISYNFNKKISLQLGANNLFNTFPSVQVRNTDSGGLWDAVQMGTNGAFYYSKISVQF